MPRQKNIQIFIKVWFKKIVLEYIAVCKLDHRQVKIVKILTGSWQALNKC